MPAYNETKLICQNPEDPLNREQTSEDDIQHLPFARYRVWLVRGKKVPQSPKPQKIQSNQKVTKSDSGWESRMGGFQEGGFSNSWTCCEFFAWKSAIQGNSYLKSTLRLLLRRRVWGQICYLKNPPSENPPFDFPDLGIDPKSYRKKKLKSNKKVSIIVNPRLPSWPQTSRNLFREIWKLVSKWKYALTYKKEMH